MKIKHLIHFFCLLFLFNFVLSQRSYCESIQSTSISFSKVYDFSTGLFNKLQSLNRFNGIKLININNYNQNKRVLNVVSFSTRSSVGGASLLGSMIEEEEDVEARLEGVPLFYPNPFKQSTKTGAVLKYKLSKSMDIQIKIFDMFANQIFEADFLSGQQGGLSNTNIVRFNSETFAKRNNDGIEKINYLSSAVYYYLILNDGKVLGKGKFVIKP